MFLLGTLVPLVSLDSAARDIFQSLVNIIDLFGIYYAISAPAVILMKGRVLSRPGVNESPA